MDTVWEQWKMEGNMCECFQFQLQNPDFLIITDLDTLINFFYYHWGYCSRSVVKIIIKAITTKKKNK